MATDIERLTISLEANLKKYEREMAKSRQVTADALNKIEREVTSRGNSIGNAFGGLARRATAAFAAISAGLSLNELRKTADEYTSIINTLKVAGVKDTAGTLDKLFESAQRNAVPLEALAQLYGRVSQAQTTLKASSQELLGLTDIVAQSLRVSGTSATEASGALLQLGQSLSGGKVQAEEYNSLLDGMYPLLQAAAAGIKEAGGDVSKLTALVKDGKVSSEAFFRGIQAGAPILEQKLSSATSTTGQALTRMRNEFVKAVGEFDRMTNTSGDVVRGLDYVTGGIGRTGQAAADAVLKIREMVKGLAELGQASGSAISDALEKAQADTRNTQRTILEAKLRGAIGPERAGIEQQLRALEQGAQNQSAKWKRAADERERFINAGKDLGDLTTQGTEIGMRGVPQPPTRPVGLGGPGVNPISLSNYAVPGDKSGGGEGGSSKAKLDAYEREIASIKRRTTELALEAQMVGKSTFEREKATAALDLENAAKKAGIPITQQMRAEMDQAATGYANAKVKVEDVTKSFEGLRDAQKYLGDAATDALTDLIVNGEKAEDVIKNLAKSLAKAAIQAALMGTGPIGSVSGIPASARPQKPQPASPERIAA